MKKSFVWLVATLAIVSLSCTKKPKHLSHIPNNSIAVLALDVNSIGKKSFTFADIVKSFSSQDTLADAIKNSGIDLLNTFYVFGGGTGEENVEFGALFAIDDAAKFETFAFKQFKITDKKFESKADVKYLKYGEGVVAYKGEVGLIFFTKNNLDGRALEILNAKEDNSLAKGNKHFATSLQTPADIKLWLDYSKIAALAKRSTSYASFLSATTEMKDAYLTTDINFEDGKIVGSYHFDAPKEVMDKIAKLSKSSVGGGLVKEHPGNDLSLVFASAYDLKELVAQYPDLRKVDANLQNIAQDLNYDKLSEIFTGEIVASVNGIQTIQKETKDIITDSVVITPKTVVNFAVSLGITDVQKLNPVLDSLIAKGFLVKNGDSYTAMGGVPTLFVKGNSIQIIGFEDYAVEVASGKTAKIAGEELSLLTANASAVKLDLTKIKPEALEVFGKDTRETFELVTIETIIAKNQKPSAESSKGEFEINFKDKKQNSLRSLGQMVTEINKKAEERRKKQEEEMKKLLESLNQPETGLADTTSAPTELP